MKFSESHQQILLNLARQSIAYGLQHHTRLPIQSMDYPPELSAILSTFVTLHSTDKRSTDKHSANKLRGCIGGLRAHQALIEDVAQHAYAAAFEDPRFPALTTPEFDTLRIEISVLSPQTIIKCQTEAELLATLRPGQDGLTLKDGNYHGTFLPTVWEQLPNKQDFVTELKSKAGMPSGYWSTTLQVFRYSTISFSEL